MKTSAPASNRFSLFLLVAILTLVLPARLWAGSGAVDERIHEPKALATFAKQVERYAAAEGARVFIIARQGRLEADLPEGISFTHTAIAVYSTITREDGTHAKGYAIHNLYQKADKVNESELIVDYPVDFFWSAKSLTAGIVIPTPELQSQLLALIASGKNENLHNPKYSSIANPFNSILQNCTEYTLDTINAAIYGTTNIKQLKVNAAAHFTPVKIKESPLKIAIGSMVLPDVSVRDHKGTIATATFTSIARYLEDNNLVKKSVMIQADGTISELF